MMNRNLIDRRPLHSHQVPSAPNSMSLPVDSSPMILRADSEHRISQPGLEQGLHRSGAAGFSGQGGPAGSSSSNQPWGVAIDATGVILVADESNARVRRVSSQPPAEGTVPGGNPEPDDLLTARREPGGDIA